MNLSRYLILMLLVVVTSACIQLRGPTLPSQYFVLEAMTNVAATYPTKDLTIAIELTDFPDYLKRPQIVSQRHENIIYFTDTYRWATPLEDQVVSLLGDNLELLLPQATINVSPWHGNRHIDYILQLSVKKLSGTLGQQSAIDIRWQIIGKDDNNRRGHYSDHQVIAESHDDLVRALNRGLEGLSAELALALAAD